MRYPPLYSGCPIERPYHGAIDYCAICECKLLMDDWSERKPYVDGLGHVCVACFLKEVERGVA